MSFHIGTDCGFWYSITIVGHPRVYYEFYCHDEFLDSGYAESEERALSLFDKFLREQTENWTKIPKK